MPRLSCAIAIGYPHHITQRGNYRQTVFAEEGDYARYVELLAGFAPKHGLEIWAYCLMPNHVHFVGVPGRQESLARTFNTVHMQYAQYFNRKRNATGHLWRSAKSHIEEVADPLLSVRCFLTKTVKDWGQYLGQDQDREATAGVVKATKIGRPCGKEDFVKQMEGLLNRRFTARPRGRPWNKEEE